MRLFITKSYQAWTALVFIFMMTISGWTQELVINDQDYFETPGLNVMVFHDYYPEGHQGGVTIIQNGQRVASNGDLRLEPAPGQWQPVPKMGERVVDRDKKMISINGVYPDPDRDRKGFNPIRYPDLHLTYTIHVQALAGNRFRLSIDLDKPLDEKWTGRVGFNLELFPQHLFGKTFLMDGKSGVFPRQLNGPMLNDDKNGWINQPLAEGGKLVIVPENDSQRMTIEAKKGSLQLIDGRALHNNGWFIVRGVISSGQAKGAVDWEVTAHVLPDWQYTPVIHVSQVGYAPAQKKMALIECDIRHEQPFNVKLIKWAENGDQTILKSAKPTHWGPFKRYRYFQFDFSEISESGVYVISYGDQTSHPFRIASDIYDRHVWQPTLEYFLPVQMCHMRINDRYRVWHGLCLMDDALMAPVDVVHFDGYRQGPSTLTSYQPGQAVPGLNAGGWHDAGDYDLRVESQAGTVRMLALAYEQFGIDYDETMIDQQNHLVELHRPDGKPDALQQIEHGLLTILGGYDALGRLYRGIICNDLRQYVMLGDASAMTDNLRYKGDDPIHKADDRWVFTEDNPGRVWRVIPGLVAAYRVLKEYNPGLAERTLKVAEKLYTENKQPEERQGGRRRGGGKIDALCELILATDKQEYKDALLASRDQIIEGIVWFGWSVGRVLPQIDDEDFRKDVTDAVRKSFSEFREKSIDNPFGVPYQPQIWGAGWTIQRFGVSMFFLHKNFPDIVPAEYVYNALDFMLGLHPGANTASFASGVGAHSVEVAYGVNRADWSFIPGGVVSGTGLIRPDFFELKTWPFFWQQTEYVLGGGGTNFMFLALAARELASRN